MVAVRSDAVLLRLAVAVTVVFAPLPAPVAGLIVSHDWLEAAVHDWLDAVLERTMKVSLPPRPEKVRALGIAKRPAFGSMPNIADWLSLYVPLPLPIPPVPGSILFIA